MYFYVLYIHCIVNNCLPRWQKSKDKMSVATIDSPDKYIMIFLYTSRIYSLQLEETRGSLYSPDTRRMTSLYLVYSQCDSA